MYETEFRNNKMTLLDIYDNLLTKILPATDSTYLEFNILVMKDGKFFTPSGPMVSV